MEALRIVGGGAAAAPVGAIVELVAAPAECKANNGRGGWRTLRGAAPHSPLPAPSLPPPRPLPTPPRPVLPPSRWYAWPPATALEGTQRAMRKLGCSASRTLACTRTPSGTLGVREVVQRTSSIGTSCM